MNKEKVKEKAIKTLQSINTHLLNFYKYGHYYFIKNSQSEKLMSLFTNIPIKLTKCGVEPNYKKYFDDLLMETETFFSNCILYNSTINKVYFDKASEAVSTLRKKIILLISNLKAGKTSQIIIKKSPLNNSPAQKEVYNLIRQKPNITHQNIAKQTGFKKPRVTSILQSLLKKKLIKKSGKSYKIKD